MEQNHVKAQMRQFIEKMEKEYIEYNRKIDEFRQQNGKLKLQTRDQEFEFKQLLQSYNQLENKFDHQLRFYQDKDKECLRVKTTKDEWVLKVNNLKNTVYNLEREIDEQNKIAEEDKKMINELTRDQNTIRNNLSKAKRVNEEQKNEEQKAEKENKKMQRDHKVVQKEIQRFNQEIERLTKEKEKRGNEATQANGRYYHLLEEIKLKDNLISEFQKKNLETEAKLKQQQNLYEAVRSDRNHYSKQLTETQNEITEIRKKYKIIMYQISQYKEEISAKEQDLTNEYFAANTLDKNCEALEKQNNVLDNTIKAKENEIKNFKDEIAKLQFIIKESEQQKVKLTEQYEMIVSERDILGTQLIRRNEELDLLYEKIKIQHSTLKKGEVQYRDKLNMIENLKETTGDLMRALKLFKKQVQEIPDLKRDVHSLHKELIEEKLKVKALSEELENPMNVHRWRKLEGTESEAYEMITKIHTLQKRLIAKTDEVKVKIEVINSQEKIINELRDSMKRQPGISETEMISQYQETVKEKNHQLRAIQNELAIQQTKANEHKYEIERLLSQLKEIKKKNYDLKKKEQLIKEKRRKENKLWLHDIVLPEKRFVGGGFNLMT